VRAESGCQASHFATGKLANDAEVVIQAIGAGPSASMAVEMATSICVEVKVAIISGYLALRIVLGHS
jgi:hypothetical protein